MCKNWSGGVSKLLIGPVSLRIAGEVWCGGDVTFPAYVAGCVQVRSYKLGSVQVGKRRVSRVLAVVVAAGAFSPAASADTLPWALIQAYQNNPQITAQRAAVRATDESVPAALSGYRPRVSATYTGTEQYLETTQRAASPRLPHVTSQGLVSVHSYGTTISQNSVQRFPDR